jgi:glycine betaine/proline transport system substrate-binding protein
MKSVIKSALSVVAVLAIMPGMAFAKDAGSCKTVRFSDVGWTDITATTAATSEVLKGLGYMAKTEVLSAPVTFTSMKNKKIDVFLGNWMPTMEADRKPYLDKKQIEVIGANLEGAKYTLAVPAYTYDAGLKTFAPRHGQCDLAPVFAARTPAAGVCR